MTHAYRPVFFTVIIVQVFYWSGSVTPLVYDYTADARRWFTIRDTLAGMCTIVSLSNGWVCLSHR